MPSVKVYGVLWESDANGPYKETRLHVVVSGKLATHGAGDVSICKELERLCQIKDQRRTYYADVEKMNSEDVDGATKDIEGKPQRGKSEALR